MHNAQADQCEPVYGGRDEEMCFLIHRRIVPGNREDNNCRLRLRSFMSFTQKYANIQCQGESRAQLRNGRNWMVCLVCVLGFFPQVIVATCTCFDRVHLHKFRSCNIFNIAIVCSPFYYMYINWSHSFTIASKTFTFFCLSSFCFFYLSTLKNLQLKWFQAIKRFVQFVSRTRSTGDVCWPCNGSVHHSGILIIYLLVCSTMHFCVMFSIGLAWLFRFLYFSVCVRVLFSIYLQCVRFLEVNCMCSNTLVQWPEC